MVCSLSAQFGQQMRRICKALRRGLGSDAREMKLLKRLARLVFFWPGVLLIHLGIGLVELADTRLGRITIRPLFSLICRWILYARAIPMFREKQQQVLPSEELSALLDSQRIIAVIPCACRAGRSTCQHPVHSPHESETCLSMGLLAVLQVATGVGRRISATEALAICRRAAQSGLSHHGLYSLGKLAEICNCCMESCAVLRAFHRGIPEVVRPSAFLALRGEACDGCKGSSARLCEEICAYGFAPSNPDCLGCGLCARHCPQQAIRMVPRTGH